MSQEELAERSGLSVRTVRRLEADVSLTPRQQTVRLLLDALAGPELTEAQRQVLRQEIVGVGADPAAGRAVPAQLPASAAGFVGPRDKVDQLDQFLETCEATRTVVISAVFGMAGVGETTLAVHWAGQVASQFPDGQLYISVRGFDPGGVAATLGEVMRSVLDALGESGQRTLPM